MKTIMEYLESVIPYGKYCNAGFGNSHCPYLVIKRKGGVKGDYPRYYCCLSEEFVEHKNCEINMEV